jgi:hypothetical protein
MQREDFDDVDAARWVILERILKKQNGKRFGGLD